MFIGYLLFHINIKPKQNKQSLAFKKYQKDILLILMK